MNPEINPATGQPTGSVPVTDPRLRALQVYLTDALRAGKYLSPGMEWGEAGTAAMLPFQDRGVRAQQHGQVLLADTLTYPVVDHAVWCEQLFIVMISARLSDGVDLGRERARRIRFMDQRNHYWAVYLLDTATLVTIGSPPSSCRLVGEVINLQMPEPFVLRRVCAECRALNEYRDPFCAACGAPMSATGRLR